MNGAKYAAYNIDALDFEYGGGSGSATTAQQQQAPPENNQPLYRGAHTEQYDPSQAAQAALGGYSTGGASASRLSNQQQQQQQTQTQQLMLAVGGTVNDYLPREDSILNSFLGGAAPGAAFARHIGTNGSALYQQHTTSTSPFDPLPIAINPHATTNNTAAAAGMPPRNNTFEDFLLTTIPTLEPSAGGINGTFAAAKYTTTTPPPPEPPQQHEPWLEDFRITVASLSVQPLSGVEVVTRLQMRMDDVVKKYLPCVDFLVQCQQDLRKGLMLAQRKVGASRRYFQQISPKQFFAQYVEPLPDKFASKNRGFMDQKTLGEAYTALEKLRDDAKGSCGVSCEAVKNNFLGGMKEGESWGLRKWLSRHGHALAACTDLECILKALKNLDKTAESTKKLAELLRPLASQTLNRLKSDVPASYQERSSAHPYLPFFHRLEGALRDVSQFDPDDDGVICLDDSDDDDDDIVVEVKPPPKKPKPKPKPRGRKRKAQDPPAVAAAAPAQEQVMKDDASSSGSEQEVVEIVGMTGDAAEGPIDDGDHVDIESWKCKICSAINTGAGVCPSCGGANDGICGDLEQIFNSGTDAFVEEQVEDLPPAKEPPPPPAPKQPAKKRKRKSSKANKEQDTISHLWPTPVPVETIQAVSEAALRIAAKLEALARYFFEHREHEVRPLTAPPGGTFWSGERYGDALILFGSLLRSVEAAHFMEPVNEDLLMNANPERSRYTHVIKNPICFRDIASAILVDPCNESCGDYADGTVPQKNFSNWNMWKGMDLLQALDMVFLNSLAYGKVVGEGRSRHRARTNELRKFLWSRIQEIVAGQIGPDDAERKRQYTPTRRSENSGFVVFKIKE